ncbi:unnamed protein product [Calypogeia fissa]
MLAKRSPVGGRALGRNRQQTLREYLRLATVQGMKWSSAERQPQSANWVTFAECAVSASIVRLAARKERFRVFEAGPRASEWNGANSDRVGRTADRRAEQY